MNVAILKYNAGNVYSVACALRRLGIEAVVTEEGEELRRADKVIVPGVGEARTAMQYLRERRLDRMICDLRQPTLGICLGMQLMCRFSEEGQADCLHIFDVDVKRFSAPAPGEKIPHMGWNTLSGVKEGLFDRRQEGAFVYFVHSYYVPLHACTAAAADYILPFSAALHKDNFYGTQFHPEKSGAAGEAILKNFLNL
jgi:glutamine amidotransferase